MPLNLAKDCSPPAFDVAVTSGYYAAMAAVLAGFAFTALVMLLTPTQVEQRRSQPAYSGGDVFLAFMAAFVALIVSTLTYSVLAGEDVGSARGRAATQELVDGLPFGLAVVMLFHGLALLVGREHDQRTLPSWTARVFTTVVGPILTLFYLVNGMTDTESARAVAHKAACASTTPYLVGLALTVAMTMLLTAAIVLITKRPDWFTRFRWCRDIAPVTVLALSVLSALVAGDVATREPQFLFSSLWIMIYLIVAFVLLTCIGLMLMMAYPAGSAVAPPAPIPTQPTAPPGPSPVPTPANTP
jgi:hypothetical protein